MNPFFEEMARRKALFLASAEDEIALSSRIRLARNIAGMPFPVTGKGEALQKVRELVRHAVGTSDGMLAPEEYDIPGCSELEKRLLLERRLISPEMLHPRPEAFLIAEKDESSSIMIHEEDHLRIQSIAPGRRLQEVWEKINVLDNVLAEKLPFAFDPKTGYLTACPSNLGTGMRASVMLHLPGLALSGELDAVKLALGKLDFAVRGFFGEGSKNIGNLYQVSNQSTLGESEEEIIARLDAILCRVILHERNAREMLYTKKKQELQDRIGRAYGMLRYSYLMNQDEALEALSFVRLGTALGMFRSLDLEVVSDLFLHVQEAHLQFLSGRSMNEKEANGARAGLLRQALKSRQAGA